ncbi:hypothetical protein P3W55_02040 [Pseudomonas citronellolis]|uniref:Uncharacterized protein n=2 Tax=Pseudomonas citronellolis TaxID=53408 RepID=A0AAW6P1C0_9PSED|nr:hypothetical protein [Pseudomonas citronellolis]MDF3840485.1 hypothetical protein [Pseudomonas citronellolis]WRT82942.1 hypothetical protein VK748_00455 [Pseudomonas citronellolis]
MSMALKQTLDFDGLRVQVRELTVGEIRQLLKTMADGSGGDLVDDMLLEEIGLAELQLMTNLEPEQLDDLAPSQLRQVYEACREVNKDFFDLRARVEQVGQRILAKLSGSSNETPAP